MYQYARREDRLSLLESTLQWRHLCPTAPDTLACYPFATKDPFVLEQAPHVLFAGCQPAFGTRLVEGPGGQRTRLVNVPRMDETGVAVLVNLRTLAVHPMSFSTAGMGVSTA